MLNLVIYTSELVFLNNGIFEKWNTRMLTILPCDILLEKERQEFFN